MINLTFLGTSDSIPSVKRNHTAILLTYKGENILIDCGEGTQRQFRKASLNPCKITRILLTHKHADHTLGIPGLLKTLELSGYGKTLHIYGPRGIREFMKKVFDAFGKIENYKIEINEVSGKVFENDDFYLESKIMTHGVPCIAYSFVKKGHIRIDKEKLKKIKIPEGKHLQKLKEGKDMIYSGKKYLAKNLTFRENDKKITFVLDTSINDNTISLAKDSDLLICEASYSSDLKDKAKEFKHLTAKQAAEIAKKSKSKKLILTHISQRYDGKLKEVLEEANKIFKDTGLVNDLDVVEV